jgi:hypothetical protein
MKLIANFYCDWVEILKDILLNQWCYDISRTQNDEIPLLYFNAEQRLVVASPRKIEISESFECPNDLVVGWNILKDKIESGFDIVPNLSKLVTKITSKDFLLNDWGVHHFHLGERIEGGFVSRTGPLLFGLVTKDIFYAIGIFAHGEWANEEIVNIIHKNWPEIISEFKIQNGTELQFIPTPKDRLKLRSNQINSSFQCTDGTTYSSIGGGSVMSGFRVESTVRMIQQKKYLNSLQEFVENQLPLLINEFEKQGYHGEEELVAKLEITENQYNAIFPEYNYRIILNKRV